MMNSLVVKLAVGNWLLAVGYWPLAIGYWPLAIGRWQLAVGYWQLAVGHWLLATCFWFSLNKIKFIGLSMLVTHSSRFKVTAHVPSMTGDLKKMFRATLSTILTGNAEPGTWVRLLFYLRNT